MYVVVNPPHEDDVSYKSFMEQKAKILQSFSDRAKLVADTLNSIEGFTCNTVQGALYAFPKVHGAKNHFKSSLNHVSNVSR